MSQQSPISLVVLAAGMGSRFGGLKQLEAVGPGGETIMDYSVFDARRAGIERIVFVIREDFDRVFRETIGSRYERHITVRYAYQRRDSLPAGFTAPPERAKPWGTAHAVLSAADVVDGPFVVANADDFYGASSYAALAGFLRSSPKNAPHYAMVGYRLRDTMSETGTVSRGVCRCDHDGWLQSIVETVKIEKHGSDGRSPGADGTPTVLNGDTLVSMNLWAFQPRFFDELRNGFTEFLRAAGATLDKEYYLPVAVQSSMQTLGVRVRVLRSDDAWCGVTHREDLPHVRAHVAGLVSRGVYPAALWVAEQ